MNKYYTERQFFTLNEKKRATKVIVKRDGKLVRILTQNVLVGDIIHIHSGEILPVNIILLKTHGHGGLGVAQTQTNTQSQLNSDITTGITRKFPLTSWGERDNIPENNIKHEGPFLLGGSRVMYGGGIGVVGAVGDNVPNVPNISHIYKKKYIYKASTQLELKLEKLGHFLGGAGLLIGAVIFILLLLHLLLSIHIRGISIFSIFSIRVFNIYLQNILLCICIIIMAVPEGISCLYSIAIAHSIHKIKDQGNIYIQNMSSCENLAGVREVLLGKSGVVTKGDLDSSVLSVYAEDKLIRGNTLKEAFIEKTIELICQSIALNSTAELVPCDDGEKEYKQFGSRLECILLKLTKDLGINYEQLRVENMTKRTYHCPYSPSRGKMTTIIKIKDKIRIYVLGGSEIVLNKCDKYVNKKGKDKSFTGEKKKGIEESIINELGRDFNRTISLAYKDINLNQFDESKYDESIDPQLFERDEISNNLTLTNLSN